MSQTSTRPRTELVVADRAPVRYVHTRGPSPAFLVVNGAVAGAVLVGAAALVGGFTGRLDVESPLLLVLIALVYALGTVAWVARSRADRNAIAPEVTP